ncbi:hypothetical protein LIER_26527 [Lithospermum erythrorhizon]|uniref:Uncharacterized protein n=1 Tax=Lithospermum erythrorhizon TaxID=34254 RepID=A0AAV3RBQ8_LITER
MYALDEEEDWRTRRDRFLVTGELLMDTTKARKVHNRATSSKCSKESYINYRTSCHSCSVFPKYVVEVIPLRNMTVEDIDDFI